MTIQVGRNDIKLGWQTAWAILVSLVVTTGGAVTIANRYLAKQDEMYRVVMKQPKTDSVQDDQLDTLFKGQAKILATLQDIRDNTDQRARVAHPAKQQKFYIERKVNGRIVLQEATNN